MPPNASGVSNVSNVFCENFFKDCRFFTSLFSIASRTHSLKLL